METQKKLNRAERLNILKKGKVVKAEVNKEGEVKKDKIYPIPATAKSDFHIFQRSTDIAKEGSSDR
jgi:hypothetical protein